MQGKYFNLVSQEEDVETREKPLAQYLALAKAQDFWMFGPLLLLHGSASQDFILNETHAQSYNSLPKL